MIGVWQSIYTERFHLKPLTVDDVSEDYLSWFSDKTIQKYIENPPENKNAMKSLKSYVSERENREDVLFLGIFEKETGNHIGNVKYEPVDNNGKYAVVQ